MQEHLELERAAELQAKDKEFRQYEELQKADRSRDRAVPRTINDLTQADEEVLYTWGSI